MRQQAFPVLALGPQTHRRVKQFFRQSALGPHAAGNSVMQHFVEPWYSRHQCRGHLDKIVGDLIGAFAVPNLGLDLERQMHASGMFVRVR